MSVKEGLDIRSIIIGILMGDGYAEKRKDKTRITVKQGLVNESYLLWLHEIISREGYCSKERPKRRKQISKRGVEKYYLKFNTYSYSSFNEYRDKFYGKFGRKRLPIKIKEYLTPLAVAIWLADDGFVRNNGSAFCTDNFNEEEVIKLKDIFKERYGIEAGVYKHMGKYNRIYIKRESMGKFRELIGPYLHESKRYKLGSWMKS